MTRSKATGLGALGHPVVETVWKRRDASLCATLQVKGPGGASGSAQTATDATANVHQAQIVGQVQRAELAAWQAVAATYARTAIDKCGKIGAGDGGWDAEFGLAAQHATAASATVADVGVPVAKVTGGMHKACLFRLVEDAQRLFFIDGTYRLRVGKHPCYRRKYQAAFQETIAASADQFLLKTANAVGYAPGFGILQKLTGSFKGVDLDAGRNCLLDGNDPIDGRRMACKRTMGIAIVSLEEHGELLVNPGQLLFIEANGRGHQAKDESSILTSKADPALANHGFQRTLGGPGIQTSASCNLVD